MEEHLTALGNRLLHPPSSVDELLSLLDGAEDFLSKVEQSPDKSLQTALSSLMKALIEDELLKHSDIDVKVAVVSCISEITRITAPDAPYDDEKMKDIFQLIVSSFENLSDQSSRSYAKRAMILETVAKVRSCVIMLDLECEQMIIEMIQHFLKAIRDDHPENIFTSMETIMTLVIEESEEISAELLTPLLASVKRNNEEALPVATKLGKSVFEKCAVKLKPCLMRTIKSLGISLDDYSEVVTSICKGSNGTVSDSTCGDQMVVEKKSVSAFPDLSLATQVDKDVKETILEEHNPNVIKSTKSIVSNGINETGNGGSSTDADFMKAETHDGKLASKTESVDLGAQISISSESKTEQAAKKRGRKPNSPNYSAETSDIVGGKKAMEQVPDHQNSQGKDIHDSPGEGATLEAANPVDKVKETGVQICPSKTAESEALNVASPSASGSLLNETQPKKAGRKKRKVNLIKEKRVSAGAASKKASDGASDSETKKQRRVGRREPDEIARENQVLDEEDAHNYVVTTSNSEAKLSNQTPASANSKMKDASSSRKEDGIKRGRKKARVEKDMVKSSAKDDAKDMVASPRPPIKSTIDEGNQEDTTRMSTKRKRTPGTGRASGIEYGANLVGSKVKVWWPKDRKFYEGVIDSFDSAKKKHKILYSDGDEETLNLIKERWEFLEYDTVADGGQPVELASTDTSPGMLRKKAKTNPEASSSKSGKTKFSHESKLKNLATKLVHKSKDGTKPEPKSEDNTSVSGDKSEDDASDKFEDETSGKSNDLDDSLKSLGKSKDVDTVKTPSHSKKDAQKTAKSKGKTPQSCNPPSSNGRGKTKSSSKEKAAESGKMPETVKGKAQDTNKKAGSDAKSGKKRKK